MSKLQLLDLFSGIGGFSLGLERSGYFETVAFCEIDPFCRRVLKKHWPDVPQYDDVTTLTKGRLDADGISVNAICGGFPCQDVSYAGNRAGLEGDRSGLWREFARVIGELRPAVVIVENTPGLLSLGMGTVLGDLASLGYDAEWHCIPASAVGADHIRDRVWIVANINIAGRRRFKESGRVKREKKMGEDAANANPLRQPQLQGGISNIGRRISHSVAPVFPREHQQIAPLMVRGFHGLPNRMDRVGALGNTVVPQVVEVIGRAIGEGLAA